MKVSFPPLIHKQEQEQEQEQFLAHTYFTAHNMLYHWIEKDQLTYSAFQMTL